MGSKTLVREYQSVVTFRQQHDKRHPEPQNTHSRLEHLTMATSYSQSTPQPSAAIPLPEGLSADSVDTLPVLSAVLSRLQNLSTPATASAASPPTPSPLQVVNGAGLLTIKDVPAATDQLKHKLQRARAQVKELPDIDRSLAEQQEEIRELEERIAKQRGVLETLRQAGAATSSGGQGRSVDVDAMET